MSVSLQQVLGYNRLGKVIKAVQPGVPNPLPPALMTMTGQTDGNIGLFSQLRGSRKTMPVVPYGAPPVRLALEEVDEVPIKLLHTHAEKILDATTLMNLRALEEWKNNMGIEKVGWELAQLATRAENTRTIAVGMLLNRGVVYVDASGNILPTSSGAVQTITINVNANNQAQLNGVIPTSWADAMANIPLDIETLQQRAAQLTGYPIRWALYGKNVSTYITNNDACVPYLSRNPGRNEEFLSRGVLPDQLFGLNWVPMASLFYEDSGSVNRTIWGDNDVVFLPDITAEQYQLVEGTYPVPRDINIVADLDAAFRNIEPVSGKFAYAQVTTMNGVGIRMVSGDVFLPFWRIPDSLFQAVVAF